MTDDDALFNEIITKPNAATFQFFVSLNQFGAGIIADNIFVPSLYVQTYQLSSNSRTSKRNAKYFPHLTACIFAFMVCLS